MGNEVTTDLEQYTEDVWHLLSTDIHLKQHGDPKPDPPYPPDERARLGCHVHGSSFSPEFHNDPSGCGRRMRRLSFGKRLHIQVEMKETTWRNPVQVITNKHIVAPNYIDEP